METLVALGDNLKSLDVSEDGTKARIGGYLVHFGTPDLVGDYFTASTEFGPGEGHGKDALIHHGLPLKRNEPRLDWTRSKKLAPLSVYRDDIGLFAETVCDLADAHEAKIHELVLRDKLKWSSGADSPQVRRRDGAKAGEILCWPIIEGSLTPTPCQHGGYTAISSLKSLVEDIELDAEVEAELKYDSRQPRDDIGRWTDGAGNISVGHALHVAASENLAPHHVETLKEGITSGRLNTREKVLEHIDAGHRQSSIAEAHPHIAGMNLESFRRAPRWGTPQADALYQEVRSITSKNPQIAQTEHSGALQEATGKREALEEKFKAAGGIIHGIDDTRYKTTNESNKEKRDLVEKIKAARSEEGRISEMHRQAVSAAIHGHVHGMLENASSANASSHHNQVDAIAKERGLTGIAKETLHDEVARSPHLKEKIGHLGAVIDAAAQADGQRPNLSHVLEAVHYLDRPESLGEHIEKRRQENDELNQERQSRGLSSLIDRDLARAANVARLAANGNSPEARAGRRATYEAVQRARQQINAPHAELQRVLNAARGRKSTADTVTLGLSDAMRLDEVITAYRRAHEDEPAPEEAMASGADDLDLALAQIKMMNPCFLTIGLSATETA